MEVAILVDETLNLEGLTQVLVHYLTQRLEGLIGFGFWAIIFFVGMLFFWIFWRFTDLGTRSTRA